MIAYTLNRSDRLDRWLLYKGAMANAGFAPQALHREDALKMEDYPSKHAVCEAAEREFPEYFGYHKQSVKAYPGIGHLVCSWGTMRAWRRIAAQSEMAVFTCDDYYLRDKGRLERLISLLGNPVNVIQLAHHTRDDLFLRDEHDLELPYRFGQYQRSPRSPHDLYEGAYYSSSDCLLLSPWGAGQVLEYLSAFPALNTEPAVQGMAQAWLHDKWRYVEGIYSVVANDTSENGKVVMRNNGWIGHLIEYTDGAVSDLEGFH